MKIGAKIRIIREIRGISQEAIATHLHISPQAYGKIEREETKLDFARIEVIAKYLDVTVEEIMVFDTKNILKNTFKDQSIVDNWNVGGNKEKSMIIEQLLNTVKDRFEKQDKLLEMNMRVIERFTELITHYSSPKHGE